MSDHDEKGTTPDESTGTTSDRLVNVAGLLNRAVSDGAAEPSTLALASHVTSLSFHDGTTSLRDLMSWESVLTDREWYGVLYPPTPTLTAVCIVLAGRLYDEPVELSTVTWRHVPAASGWEPNQRYPLTTNDVADVAEAVRQETRSLAGEAL